MLYTGKVIKHFLFFPLSQWHCPKSTVIPKVFFLFPHCGDLASLAKVQIIRLQSKLRGWLLLFVLKQLAGDSLLLANEVLEREAETSLENFLSFTFEPGHFIHLVVIPFSRALFWTVFQIILRINLKNLLSYLCTTLPSLSPILKRQLK